MQTQYDLFTTNSETSGFRLKYLEIFNWGTFHNRIYRIAPEGNNSLLTGANASGKSTLIDALLTLLVPAKKDRFYNQSSGNQKKGDRTEETYVLGNYGNIQSDGETSTRTQQLRDKNTYSVLLALFENNYQNVVTLFQVRWFVNNELKCIFGISTRPLTIQADFSGFNGSRGDWKKTLEKKYNTNVPRKQIDFYDTIKDYKDRIIHSLGLRSDKALTLFNQIVGVKVLNDLDDFIRNNMLDQRDAESEYIRLYESFSALIDAKTTIEKVKEQIAQLKPIDTKAKQLSDINNSLSHLQETRDIAVYWFANKSVEFAEDKLSQLDTRLFELKQQLDKLNDKKDELRKQEWEITSAIENDNVGQQIRALNNEVKTLEGQKVSRLKNLKKYNSKAVEVGFSENPSREIFVASIHKAEKEKNNCQLEFETLNEDLRHAKNEKEHIDNEIQENISILETLRKTKSNISGQVAAIRDLIVQHTGAEPQEIPFIGELIRVKDNEKKWENTIEKILHNFALCLIVPDKYYNAVNKFVNSHNLQGRIVYQHYVEMPSTRYFRDKVQHDNCLLNKVEFNNKSKYCEWVEDAIHDHYNYICVSNLEEFNHFSEKVATTEGLIKSVNDKHEKDDRPHINRLENYVLGWDNHEKIAAIQKYVKELQWQKENNTKRICDINSSIKAINQRKECYYDIITLFTSYDDINWAEPAQVIQEKNERIRALEMTNNKVKTLQNQLNDVQLKLNKLESETIKSIDEDIYQIERIDIAKARNKRSENAEILKALGVTVDTVAFENENAKWLEVNYDNIESKQKKFQSEVQRQEGQLRTEKTQIEHEVIDLIAKFKNPSEGITQRFKDWRSDVHALPDSQNIHLICEYQKFYEKLVNEDLVQHEAKFNEFLQETMTNKIADFRMFFHNWEKSIKESIVMLNKSLKEIKFNSSPDTYIQLVNTRKFNTDIAEFKRELENAIPNIHDLNATIDGRKNHFEDKIQPLIKHLGEEPWRKKVMDVRNWFSYRAEEFYCTTGQKYKTYESMGQLSGGEKAQLTYTILGSAIAYQFGLTKDGLQSNSFRFIAIDEAFKAQDEDKARYLISLCEQLHLQLLVVTPSDNIHIVENNISFVHFVQRNGNESQLINMPIMQFKKEREKYQANDHVS